MAVGEQSHSCEGCTNCGSEHGKVCARLENVEAEVKALRKHRDDDIAEARRKELEEAAKVITNLETARDSRRSSMYNLVAIIIGAITVLSMYIVPFIERFLHGISK